MRAELDYESALLGHLWSWADRYHSGELDGGSRIGRPPVLRAELASKNVLVPSDPTRACEIVSAVPKKERHQWFGSFRSSQALAQSVFGAVRSFGRLDLLEGVLAECGRPAFLEKTRGASLVLEHKVDSLGEPRPGARGAADQPRGWCSAWRDRSRSRATWV